MTSNYFTRFSGFTFKPYTILVFVVLAAVCWVIKLFVQMALPADKLIPFIAGTSVNLLLDAFLIAGSIFLIKRNGLPAKALGLSVSAKTWFDILTGILIGVLAIALLAGIFYLFVPYHFVRGPLTMDEVLKAAYSYLTGNWMEELMFRGFLLIILSQLFDWRVALLILALPFGLFHLPGIGFNMVGLKMVATTAAYSFVFGLSFVLTRSMWAAVTVHMVLNVCLHVLLGLDGSVNVVFKPIIDANWPRDFDVDLITTVASAVVTSGVLYWVIVFRGRKTASTL